VVDDMAFFRQSIIRILERGDDFKVIGWAWDGQEAIRKTLALKPDVITLDLHMPQMDGFTFLRWLMANHPTPVVVLSSQGEQKDVFKALDLGAVEFIAKPEARPSSDFFELEERIREKVLAAASSKVAAAPRGTAPAADAPAPTSIDVLPDGATTGLPSGEIEAVVIGSSTGGPRALHSIVAALPPGLPCPVLIAQHMPPTFTALFAQRLNEIGTLKVKEGADGEILRPGTAYVSPGGHHMEVASRRMDVRIRLVSPDPKDLYVPSVDRLLGSAAEVWGDKCLGVILTGMGNDGSKGAVILKRAGGRVLAESEETAVIFGMPQEAGRAGAVDRFLPLGSIPGAIVEQVTGGGGDGTDDSG
jgi:two-component system chemotaxis response regulator CheB